jgi:hypothetical protein
LFHNHFPNRQFPDENQKDEEPAQHVKDSSEAQKNLKVRKKKKIVINNFSSDELSNFLIGRGGEAILVPCTYCHLVNSGLYCKTNGTYKI